MNIILLRRFVAVAEELHFPRAADALDIPLASLYSSIEKLETEVGHPLFTRHGETRLTKFGILFLDEARAEIAAAPAPAEKPAAKAGGKAKASKGKGRAPIVKGMPKPYKKRQGR
ncbi:MAG TPA: LysR family transcriptional regulator [Microbacterium sp.]|nr:LysR family transcriptional regulator [Microbacterium sp.]